MKNAALLSGTVIVVLIGAGWYLIPRVHYADPAQPTSAAFAATAHTFAWKFTFSSSTDDTIPPRSQVDLITGGDVYDAGSHPGTCAPIASERLLPDEVSAVLCWWAGGGDEIGVFRDGSKYVVKAGSQDEGTAETAGMREDFKELFAVQR